MAQEQRFYPSDRTAISGTIPTPQKQGTLMRISANETFDKAAAGHHVIGELVKDTTVNNELAAVAMNGYRDVLQIKFIAAITAGQFVKMAAADGSGNQQVDVWVAGTDAESAKLGVCWKGAGAAAEGLILV